MGAFSWILTIIALVGTWKNSNGDRDGFYWWIAADIGLCWMFWFMGLWAQFFLFLVYTGLAIRGLNQWNDLD